MQGRHVFDLGVAALVAAMHLGCKSAPDSLGFRLAPGSPHAVGRNPTDVAVVDVDGDRRLDVVTTSVKSGELHNSESPLGVLRGDGRGGLASGVAIIAAPTLHTVVAADLDDDGDVDVLGTQHDSHDVNVLLGDGRGAFVVAPGSPVAARDGGKPHDHGLVVADFDEDGRLDALTSNQDANSVALLLGDGRGGLAIAAASPWPVGRHPYPPAVADLDADGHLDVVSPLVGGSAVAVLRGDGHGGFVAAAGEPGPITARPLSLALGDVNGDQHIDAVVAHDDTTIATVLVGDGAGGLSATHTLDLGAGAYDLALVDMNADGALDLLGTRVADGVMVLVGDGRGGFAPAPGSPYAAGAEPSAIATGDLDGDGRLDLVATNFRSNDVAVLLQE